ncbi:Hypothetical predicted protein [Pelobates cultripes]|uniref:Uncharacterized protein n=1 Tax=Pelobates cultripes TaxID=61616 RepID=A0AAD1SM62_PELCU|nr:Hypothetical predicted protein [Pelobates cultripes]
MAILMPNSAHGSTSVSEDEAGEPAELRPQPRGRKALFKRQPEPQWATKSDIITMTTDRKTFFSSEL